MNFVTPEYLVRRGRDPAEALGERWLENVHPDDREPTRELWARALRTGETYDAQFRVRFADGTYRWQLVRARPLRDAGGAIVRWVGVNLDIDDQRNRRERIEGGLRLLSRSGSVMFDSLDFLATLHNIAQAFVPDFASYCVIDTFDDAGIWRRTIVHRDDSLEPIVRNVPQPSGAHPVARALAEGVSSCTLIDTAWFEAVGPASARATAVRLLGTRSFVTVPVVTPNGRIVGGLTCARDARFEGGNYDRDDVSFVEETGRRAGAAIANARLYERERRVAVQLQAASLPSALPHLPGVTISAEYRPGSDEALIGGDWYDAFLLADGRLALSVGDVVGHGLGAAIRMTKLRQAMQAAAMIQADPNVMLTVADKTLRLIDPDGFATAIAAIYDPAAQHLSFASAGHPYPLVRSARGEVRVHRASGPMLGLRAGTETELNVIPIAPGATIVFYTDGLVEFTKDVDDGQARLHDALVQDEIALASQPALALVEAVLGEMPGKDDIAVLVVQIAGAPAAAAPRTAVLRDASV